MYLFRLVYYSRNAIKSLGLPIQSEIKSILHSAKRNNPSLGITGGLVFNDAYFAQILEGDRKAVTSSFCKLATDKRHTDLVIMSAEPIEHRAFQRWSMAYAGHSDELDLLYIKYGIALGFNPAKMTADNLLGFIREATRLEGQALKSKFENTADQSALAEGRIAETV